MKNFKNLKKATVIGALVLALSAASVTALAAEYRSPAEILADLTDKTVDSIIAERSEEATTYGALSQKYAVSDEFKLAALAQKKAFLKERVANGTMTQERADAIIAALEENQANCDGTGAGGTGSGMGAGFGGMGSGRSGGGRFGAGYGCGAYAGGN